MFGRRPRRGVSLRRYDLFFQAPLLGIDEVGTGCVAGPYYAAGCILPREGAVLDALEKLKLRDSKQMTEGNRKRVHELLTKDPSVRYWIGIRFPEEIERVGHNETLAAIFNEIIASSGTPSTIIIDGEVNRSVVYKPINWVTGGDDKSLTVAAASVIAKVARDIHMEELDGFYPEYGFSKHKGYLTKEHQKALDTYGICEAHRKWTQPIREIMARRTPHL